MKRLNPHPDGFRFRKAAGIMSRNHKFLKVDIVSGMAAAVIAFMHGNKYRKGRSWSVICLF